MNDWTWLLVELLAVLAFLQAVVWLNNGRYKGPEGALRIRQILLRLNLEAHDFKTGQSRGNHGKEGLKPTEYYGGEVDGIPVEISFEPSTGWIKHPYYTVRVCLAIFGGVQPNDVGETGRESFHWAERKILIGKFSHPSGEQLIGVARELVKEATRN